MERLEKCLFDIKHIVYVALKVVKLLDLGAKLIKTSLKQLNNESVHLFYSLRKLQ